MNQYFTKKKRWMANKHKKIRSISSVMREMQINAIMISHYTPIQFSSVTQSYLTLCNPMNPSTPDLPVHHKLLEPTQTHVYWVSDGINISFSVVPFSSHPQSFPESGSFPMSQLFASDGQISPFNEHPGLISFRMDWLYLLAIQGTLKSLLQHHSSKASILQCSAFFTVHPSHP